MSTPAADVPGARPNDTATDTDAALVRVLTLHAAIVALVALVVAVLVFALVGVPVLLALVVAPLVGAGVTAWRIRGIDDRIRTALGARPLAAGESPRLENLAESMALATGVAPPTLHVIDATAPNAVVWGATPGPPSFAITTGLLESTQRVELEAVLAYALSMARDGVEVLSTAAGLLGPLARGPLAGPVASLVRSSVDERRIVLADIEGVRATCFPPGLEGALGHLVDTATTLPGAPPALAALCFAAPIDASSPFAVHPPVADRIDLVRQL